MSKCNLGSPITPYKKRSRTLKNKISIIVIYIYIYTPLKISIIKK
jgi:hypothetical protein